MSTFAYVFNLFFKLEIHVQDNGTGIPKAILPHVFDRFYTKTYHGTGLGLSFCKTVLEKWGSQIRCETKEGEFTKFILSFPKKMR